MSTTEVSQNQHLEKSEQDHQKVEVEKSHDKTPSHTLLENKETFSSVENKPIKEEEHGQTPDQSGNSNQVHHTENTENEKHDVKHEKEREPENTENKEEDHTEQHHEEKEKNIDEEDKHKETHDVEKTQHPNQENNEHHENKVEVKAELTVTEHKTQEVSDEKNNENHDDSQKLEATVDVHLEKKEEVEDSKEKENTNPHESHQDVEKAENDTKNTEDVHGDEQQKEDEKPSEEKVHPDQKEEPQQHTNEEGKDDRSKEEAVEEKSKVTVEVQETKKVEQEKEETPNEKPTENEDQAEKGDSTNHVEGEEQKEEKEPEAEKQPIIKKKSSGKEAEKQEPKQGSKQEIKQEVKQNERKGRKPSDTGSDKSNNGRNGSNIKKKNSGSQISVDNKTKTEEAIPEKTKSRENEKKLSKKNSEEKSTTKERKGSDKSVPEKTTPKHKEEPKEKANSKEQTVASSGEIQEQPKDLGEAINSIVGFFSVTAKNVEKSLEPTESKVKEIVMNSNLVQSFNKPTASGSFITGSSLPQVDPKGNNKKKTKEMLVPTSPKEGKIAFINRVAQSPQLKQAKIITVDDQPNNVVQSQKNSPITSKNKNIRVFKAQVKPEGNVSVSVKGKNEIEEQIRQHKIQEIVKLKKNLESKLSALNDQLVELHAVEGSSSMSPPRSKSIKKETKEEAMERQRKAQEFTKKMNNEQKNIEIRNEKRRELRQIQILKDMESIQTEQAEIFKGASQSVKEKSSTRKVVYTKPSATGFSALEERKRELKTKRDFGRALQDQNSADEREYSSEPREGSKVAKKKSPKRVVYPSPMLPSVLAQDEELKRIQGEKAAKRRMLKEKQVEYGKEVKEARLPKLQSKYDVIMARGKKGIYRSQEIDEYLRKAAERKGNYQLKGVHNELHERKSSKNRLQAGVEDQPNVKYGKELVYELQDNWNLAEGTKSTVEIGEDGEQLNIVTHKDHYLIKAQDDEGGRLSHKSNNNKNKKKIKTRETEPDEEVDKLNQELVEEQLMLKDKISGMLNDIKQMETHVKKKEEKIIKEIEKRSKNSP